MPSGAIAYAALAIGGVVGLICVAIFAVTLRGVSDKMPKDAITALTALIGTVLGGGLVDYVVFGRVLSTDQALAYYLIGLAVLFLPLGILVFFDWFR